MQLKIESDGRCFPVTDDSRTVATALQRAAADAGVQTILRANVHSISRHEENHFEVQYTHKRSATRKIECASLLLATGSSSTGYELAGSLGHRVATGYPSLFSFRLLPGRSLYTSQLDL